MHTKDHDIQEDKPSLPHEIEQASNSKDLFVSSLSNKTLDDKEVDSKKTPGCNQDHAGESNTSMGKFVREEVFPSTRRKTSFEKVIALAHTHGYGSALKQVLTSEDDCYQHLNIKDFRSSWKGVEDIEAREKFGEKREVMCHDRYDI